MISVKNFHADKQQTSRSTDDVSSRSKYDVEYNKRPVYVISDKNFKAHFDDSEDSKDVRVSSQNITCKSKFDKIEKLQSDRRVIDRNTLKRLKNKAIVVTAEDRRKIVEDMMTDRERLENESTARKKKLQSYDILRTKGKQLAQVSGIFLLIICRESAFSKSHHIVEINKTTKIRLN